MLRTVLDATERHQNQEQLRSQREHSQAVLESMSEGVCVFRGSQRLLVNSAFIEMMGHANEAECLASTSLDFLPDEDRRRVERGESLVAGRRVAESSVRREDGSEIYCAVSIARTLFDGLPASVAVLRDATARLRARQDLQASERRYRGLFESAPMGITILDENAIIQDCNPAFAAMVGLPLEEIKSQRISSFTKLPPGRTPGRSMERLAKGEIDSYDSERIWAAPNPDIEWIEFRNAAVRAPDGSFEFAFSLARDITQRKRTERQRQELYWRLTESKEEQSRELAKELHDEIGQHLTGLRMQLERGTPSAIDIAIEITDELIGRVRSLSLDLRPPSLDDLGLVAALRSLVERFTERTEVEVEFIHNNADFVLSPETSIAAFRIVQEALTNVARHSGASSAMVTLLLEDGELTARIEDGGCGTTRQLGSAPGDAESTGLSGMYERALALGGDLRFTSAPGEGTIVEAVLPVGPSDRQEHPGAG
jgi:PAS domain S-box-containing protein